MTIYALLIHMANYVSDNKDPSKIITKRISIWHICLNSTTQCLSFITLRADGQGLWTEMRNPPSINIYIHKPRSWSSIFGHVPRVQDSQFNMPCLGIPSFLTPFPPFAFTSVASKDNLVIMISILLINSSYYQFYNRYCIISMSMA